MTDRIVYWQTPFGDWFKGELLAITEDGVIVNRLVPAGAAMIPVPRDRLHEVDRERLYKHCT